MLNFYWFKDEGNVLEDLIRGPFRPHVRFKWFLISSRFLACSPLGLITSVVVSPDVPVSQLCPVCVCCSKTDHCNEGNLHFTFLLQSFRSIVAVSELYIDFFFIG